MYSFSFISCGGSCSCFSHLIVTHQSCRLWLLGWEGMLHTLLRSKASSSWCSTGPKLIIVSYPVLSVHNFCAANQVYVHSVLHLHDLTHIMIHLLITRRNISSPTPAADPLLLSCHQMSQSFSSSSGGGAALPFSHQDCICLKWEKIVADLPGSSLKQQKK